LGESYRFGDPAYAREELRAELTSLFISAQTGIPHDTANHAAYVGSWFEKWQACHFVSNHENRIMRRSCVLVRRDGAVVASSCTLFIYV
jgi:antirestriction protein ArdC